MEQEKSINDAMQAAHLTVTFLLDHSVDRKNRKKEIQCVFFLSTKVFILLANLNPFYRSPNYLNFVCLFAYSIV